LNPSSLDPNNYYSKLVKASIFYQKQNRKFYFVFLLRHPIHSYTLCIPIVPQRSQHNLKQYNSHEAQRLNFSTQCQNLVSSLKELEPQSVPKSTIFLYPSLCGVKHVYTQLWRAITTQRPRDGTIGVSCTDGDLNHRPLA
jgi:hypothetical protein